MSMFNPNQAFISLHRLLKSKTINKEEFDRRLRVMLILNDKLLGPLPRKMGVATEQMSEQSGTLSYDWSKEGQLSIRLLQPWNGHGALNTFSRHVRQAARVELNDTMNDMEAVKLRVARAAGDAVFEAVMDDLLCGRAEDIVRKQGPDTRRAVNIDERFHLADNPDLLGSQDVKELIGATPDNDRER